MSVKLKRATWSLALRDEPEWREMGAPTMRAAMNRIKELEARVRELEESHLHGSPKGVPSSSEGT